MTDLGKMMVVAGLVLVVVGVLLMVRSPLGRLPGDIVYRGKHTTVYFPLMTSVVVSVMLTIVLWVVGKWRR